MSRTLTGWLVTLSGGSLGGAIVSRKFSQKARYQGFHSTSMRECVLRRAEAGNGRSHSMRFSKKLPPKGSPVNAPPADPAFGGSFTGRSTRKSLKLEKKFLSQDCCWTARSGTRVRVAGLLFDLGMRFITDLT